MDRLTVTEHGQVTLRKEVLQHLGIKPGDPIELDLLPDGQGLIRAVRTDIPRQGFVGLLKGRSTKVAPLDEITDAAAQGWANRR